ncbi:MAG: cell division protein ZipA C-terminal FtsZ-binding domain-containing protein [Halochromatium sp.]
MDASTLRLILIVLGVLLLGALYLLERRRIARGDDSRASPGERSLGARRRREPSVGLRFEDDAEGSGAAFDGDAEPKARRRGRLDLAHATADDFAWDDEDDAAPGARDRPGSGSNAGSGSGSGSGSSSRSGYGSDSGSDSDSGAAEGREPAARGASASTSSPANTLLVQLFVFAREQAFDGLAIETAAERQHLVPGEMEIYHRRNLDGSGERAHFSLANLVKPGTFPFDAMEDFSSPGLALFTQFEGLPSDLMVYDELVRTARALADELGGDLRLQDRRPFDDAAWENLRGELLELINARADALAQGSEPADADAPSSRS